ncbi:tetratricopeptide repeat protein [Pseudomonadota bacterium]
MPIFIISILIQVALVVHIVKTGRNTTWIWIVAMLPLVGSLAYLIIEVLPGLSGGRSARKVKHNIETVVNPDKDIKAAAQNFSVSDTVENAIKLAQELINKGMYDDAKQLYQNSLKGIYESDPNIMFGLARAEYGLENYARVKSILDELIEKNPDFKNPDAHLLYARAVEKLGDIALATKEYEVLDDYYPGPEATYRYAMLLKDNGHNDKSKALLKKILHKADTAGDHYNALYKEWIALAKSECRR